MIKNLIQEGFILKSKGYYKHAIENFYKALGEDSDSQELLFEIADSYYLMKDLERAVGYLEQILIKNPMHISSLRLLKQIFLDENALEEALQTAKNIYCITNSDEDLAEIFNLLIQRKSYDEIFEYNYESQNPIILYEYARAKYYKKEFAEALEVIDRCLMKSKNEKYFLLKSRILYQLQDYDTSLASLEKIKNFEQNSEILNLKGLIFQKFGEYEKSLNYFKDAIKINPKSHAYYYNCASTYFKKGDFILAQKNYNYAISLSPNNETYHFALANLFYAEKRYKRALEELEYDFFEARLLKMIILFDTGYLVLAKKEIEELEKIQPQNEILKEYKERINAEW